MAKFNKTIEWECYISDMLWATATGRTFQDSKNKPTYPRWVEKVLPVKNKALKVTKEDVKNSFRNMKI